MKFLILLPLICFALSAHAVQLFGVDLQNANQQQLRTAVKNAGVKLISEAGDEDFFDVYDSTSVLAGSTHLYLGFVKKDKQFAFAEYAFSGLKQPFMVQKLEQKYGKAQVSTGRFQSDRRFSWQSNGISITLYTDWANYQTRLVYFKPDALTLLRQEQQQFKIGQVEQKDQEQVAAY